MFEIICLYVYIASTIIATIYEIPLIFYILSLIGLTVILLSICWHITIYTYRYINEKNPISYDKKAVLVTGCDTGIGNHLAFKLNSNGVMVYATVLDTRSDGSVELITNCAFPDLMKVVKLDVSCDEDVVNAYQYVCKDLEKTGHQLWGLVNNAAVLSLGPIDWGNIETFKNMFEVNVFGLVRVTLTFLPLIRQSKGRIVNLSSLAGKLAMPFAGIYSMTKCAVNSFSEALRREMSEFGINVSIISINSEFNTNMTNVDNFPRLLDKQWTDTDENVKEYYGEQYVQNLKKCLPKVKSMLSDKLELVDHEIIGALFSGSPEICYTVTSGWSRYFAVLLLDYMPFEIIDRLMRYLLTKGANGLTFLKPNQTRNVSNKTKSIKTKRKNINRNKVRPNQKAIKKPLKN